jgi:hypothetical protein
MLHCWSTHFDRTIVASRKPPLFFVERAGLVLLAKRMTFALEIVVVPWNADQAVTAVAVAVLGVVVSIEVVLDVAWIRLLFCSCGCCGNAASGLKCFIQSASQGIS